ncbi:MAG: hypothetical protein ACJ746_24080, partial [Bryobacteraceae bacterium]
MLTVHDFEAEQDYQLGKRRLFNRNVYVSGIVAGLDVALENGTVLVSPGFALDPTGNEIIVDRPTVVDTKTCPQQRCFVM